MMNIHFPIAFILALSIVIQAAAAIMAFRLVNITGRRLAWILIAAALMLMAVRRVVPLFRLIMGDDSLPPDTLNEVIGLVLSTLMAAGISRIAPLFIERKRAEEAIHLQAVELEEEVVERQQAQESLQEQALLLEREIEKRQKTQEELENLNEKLEQRVQERTAELEKQYSELEKTASELETTTSELIQRTAELADKNRDLEHFNKLFVGRELRMVELKEQIRALEAQAGSTSR